MIIVTIGCCITFVVGIVFGWLISKSDKSTESRTDTHTGNMTIEEIEDMTIEEVGVVEKVDESKPVSSPVETKEEGKPVEDIIIKVEPEKEETIEEPKIYEPEYITENFEVGDENLGFTYIECPLEVEPNEKFYIRLGWKSNHSNKIEYKGSIQRLGFYKPVRDTWRGLLELEDGETSSVEVIRTFSCKKGISKDTTWKFRLSVYDGEKFNIENEFDREIKVINVE